MIRTMWFGTKQFSRWIKVHSPGSGHGMSGYSDRIDYLNGLVGVRESANGHMTYSLAWNRMSHEQTRQVTDFAYGIYGGGLLYLAEPSSMPLNVLNKAWSAPGLATKDAVPIAGKARPELVQNLDQGRGYPLDMAKYTLSAADTSRSFYVPIPPGYQAQIGVHGDPSSTLRVRAQPTVRGIASGVPTSLTMLSTATNARFSHTFAGGEQTGVEISLQTGTAGTITLAGIMVRVVPIGTTGGELGDFISGQGSAGLRFIGRVNPVPYSIAHDSYGLAATLEEVEDGL